MIAVILILISYLMGSICSAIIVCSMFNLPDPREEGSKNPGATNVLRLAGKQYAALVLLVDLLKGTIPLLIAHAFVASPTVLALTALAAVLGHMYPIFFGLKGGKGVATAIGALLGLNFITGVLVIATWLLVVNFSRYSSLASMISITLSPLYALLITHEITIFPPLFFMALLILYKHKDNIARLIDGSESKVFIKSNVINQIMKEEPNIELVLEDDMELEEKPAPVKLKKPSVKKLGVEKNQTVKPKQTTRKKTEETVKTKKKTTSTTKPKTKPKTTKKEKE